MLSLTPLDALGVLSSARLAAARRGVDAMNRIPVKDRGMVIVQSNHSSVLLGLGRNLGQLGQPEAGLPYLEEARDIRDRMAAQDPQNVQALYISSSPYYQLAEIYRIAGRKRDELAARLHDIGIFDRLLAPDPESRPYRFGRAEQQAAAANVAWDLGERSQGQGLAAAGIAELKAAASIPQATAADLSIAASALTDSVVPKVSDPALAVAFFERAIAQASYDIDILRGAAKAYWLTHNRAKAIGSLDHALHLLSPTLTPERKQMESDLSHYREAHD